MTYHRGQISPKFKAWIEENGGALPTSVLLGVKVRTVQWWLSGHQIPGAITVLDILNLSNGTLTPTDIVWARIDDAFVKIPREGRGAYKVGYKC